jgi:hypothetical protein
MVSSRMLPPLPNKADETNWVEKAGGLPDYMVRVAKHIYYGGGHYTLDHAIAGAVEVTKARAAKGNKEAQAAVAQWEKMKSSGSKKLSIVEVSDNKKKVITAIKLFKVKKAKYPPQKRNEMKARIKRAAKKVGAKVELAEGNLATPKRAFNEAKYRRVGGKFATKPSGEVPTSKGKPQTAKATIEALGVGADFNIPGLDGKIQRTEQGYVVTGPNGFKTTAATAQEAMAVAARLIRQKQAGKQGKVKAGAK